MGKMFLNICFFLLFLILSCTPSYNGLQIDNDFDIRDSSQVINFIKRSTLCEKLKYINLNKKYFIEDVGYSSLIVFDINKKENTSLQITLGNRYRESTDQEKEKQVEEYVDFLKNKNCNNK